MAKNQRGAGMVVRKELFGESSHVEFKAEIPKKHEKFLKDVVAFANTSGGKIVVGINDRDGGVVGIGEQNPFKLSDAISNMISDSCTPQIYTEITAETLDGKTILEIEVFPGRNRPYYLNSQGKEASSYIRINGTSRPAGEFTLKELEMEGSSVSYDSMWEIGASFDADAVHALMKSMRQTAISNCKTEDEREAVHELTIEKLEDFGILKKTEGKYVPTRAFTLLTNPKERHIKIQCALFKGTERVDFIDRKEFRGPIQDQIEAAYQFVLRHTNMGAAIDGLYRRDVYELPVRSIREIIVNAALHRSYLDPASIQTSIFDDRVEIDSPGMLYAGLTVADAVSGKSKCRNTAIAEAFQYMKIIEGWGTGLPRLFKVCKEMGLPTPKFEEFGDSIKVTIYRAVGTNGTNGTNDTIIYSNDSNENNTDRVIGANANGANDTNGTNGTNGANDATERLIDLLRNDGKITQLQICEKLGLSLRSVKRSMKELQERGVIKRVGASRTGRWEVTSKR